MSDELESVMVPGQPLFPEKAPEPIIQNSKDLFTCEGDEHSIVLLPPDWRSEKFLPQLAAPLRIRQTTVVQDRASLKAYADIFCDEDNKPRLFADERSKQIMAVLDPIEKGQPSHQDHVCLLSLDYSPEWEIWKRFCGDYVPRTKFVRFVENNLESIIGDFAGTKILEMCRDIKATNMSDLKIQENTSSGGRKLSFNSNQNVTDGGGCAFPETIEVELRVFKGDVPFKFEARLRWDYQDNELSFAIDLKASEIVEEKAFTQIVEDVIEDIGLPVLRGTYK